MDQKRLTIVVPVYNESKVLFSFHKRLSDVLKHIEMLSDIIYVNDGSIDTTLAMLQVLHEQDERVSSINLSRNFGKEIALQAGLDHAEGDAVIVIDADLQDPPELIPKLLDKWQAGYDVVYAKRISRKGETWFKKTTSYLFYRVIQKISSVRIPIDTGDFRLLSKRAVSALKLLREQHRYMKGLFSWIGYSQTEVPFERDPRLMGETKWNYWKLLNLAIEGLTSFSTTPLRMATFFGFLTALCAFFYALFVIYKTLFFGEDVRGYASLMVVILFLGGIQLISLGVIGEYLGRMFGETKQRPLYLLEKIYRAKVLDSLATKYSTTAKTAASLPAIEAVTK